MKKKLLLMSALLCSITTTILAAPITEIDAKQKASEFISEKSAKTASIQSKAIVSDEILFTTAEVCDAFYVFNNETNGGYIIVSADDRMPAVLGYSYSGMYNSDEIPDNMRSWLNGYVEQYEYMLQHDDVSAVSTTSVTGDKIYPLLTSKWNQSYPYNALCPQIDGISAFTGCVATAMAQIIYYHQWPSQTTMVIPAYTTSGSNINVPSIGITSINYDNILSEYTEDGYEKIFPSTQEKEVANLMKLCGASVNMDYGIEESGASTSAAKDALVSYFGYKETSLSLIKRSGYQQSMWNQIIYDELKNSRPVFYSGTSSSESHAFIIDGYDKEGYFHVNWGWGGYQDGYFLLNSLNGYNSGQTAIIGIEPPNGLVEHKYAYATYKDNTLTFHYDNKRNERLETMYTDMSPYYDNKLGVIARWYDNAPYVESVIFDASFRDYKPTNIMTWFKDFTALTSIQGIEYLNTQNVSDMRDVFRNCTSLTSLNLSGFNTKNVTDMSMMFYECSNLSSLDVSNFDTQNVTNMMFMFNGCTNLESLNLSSFDTSNVTDMSFMFFECNNLGCLDVSSFNTQNVTNMRGMFRACKKLTDLDLRGFNTKNVTNIWGMFYECNNLTHLDLSSFNTSNVSSMEALFYDCNNLTSINLSSFNTQNVTDMSSMFENCGSLTSIDLSSFDTKNVTNMKNIFKNCNSLRNLDVSSFNTQNVTNMGYMFYNCRNLTSLDVSNFNTRNVTDMRYLFYKCNSLTSIDMESFNTHNVTNMTCMFYQCNSLSNLNLSNFDTQNVGYMGYMFYDCNNFTILDVSSFYTKNVVNMEGMFGWCNSTRTIAVGDNWNTNNVTASSGMFAGCFRLIGQDGTKYNSNNTKDATMAHYGTGGYLTYKASSAIDKVTSVTVNKTQLRKFYSLDGKKYTAPQKSINFIKMSDGTMRKIVK